jgi:hypothetical protein
MCEPAGIANASDTATPVANCGSCDPAYAQWYDNGSQSEWCMCPAQKQLAASRVSKATTCRVYTHPSAGGCGWWTYSDCCDPCTYGSTDSCQNSSCAPYTHSGPGGCGWWTYSDCCDPCVYGSGLCPAGGNSTPTPATTLTYDTTTNCSQYASTYNPNWDACRLRAQTPGTSNMYGDVPEKNARDILCGSVTFNNNKEPGNVPSRLYLNAVHMAAEIFQESEWIHDKVNQASGTKGIAQFRDATWATYGVDANCDGTVDVFDREDAIYTMGIYLWNAGNAWRNNRHTVPSWDNMYWMYYDGFDDLNGSNFPSQLAQNYARNVDGHLWMYQP